MPRITHPELPRICRDLEWFDEWRQNRARMNLENDVPDRLMEYLRAHLHLTIATHYPNGANYYEDPDNLCTP